MTKKTATTPIAPGAIPTEFAIETRGLGRRYGSRWAVRGLDLQVPRGSVFGFLGLNGAGKSTTIRLLMGLLDPHEGHALVEGIDPARHELEVKRRVGYVAEKPHFYEWMTVREIMAFVAHYRRESWDAARADHLVRVFRLPLDQQLRTLSKGQGAKVSLVLAMAFNPDTLILDEPTGGLDPVVRREFIEGLLAEYMEGGRTVFISSHLINEISGLVDRVGILTDGRLTRCEPTEALLGAVKRLRLGFEGGAPRTLAMPDQVRAKLNGREALVTVDRFDAERTLAAARATGATAVDVEDLGLEDIFVELNSWAGDAADAPHTQPSATAGGGAA